jgi:hypothetical protein
MASSCTQSGASSSTATWKSIESRATTATINNNQLNTPCQQRHHATINQTMATAATIHQTTAWSAMVKSNGNGTMERHGLH